MNYILNSDSEPDRLCVLVKLNLTISEKIHN